MVNAQISATGGTASVAPARSVKKAARAEDAAFDFGQMMNQSLSGMTQQKKPDFTRDSSKDMTFGAESGAGATKIKDVSRSRQTQKADSGENVDSGEKQNVQDPEKSEDADTAKKSDTKDTALTEEAGALREKIKETLDVTDEQIDEALAALSVTLMDLLNEDVMPQFVALVTGNESTLDLLTDNTLSQGLFELENFAAQMSMELNDAPRQIVVDEADIPQVPSQETVKEEAFGEEVLEEEVSGPFVMKSSNEEILPTENAERTPQVTVKDNRTTAGTGQTSQDSGRQGNQGNEHNEHNAGILLNNLSNAVESVMEVAQVQGVDNYTAVSIVNQIVDAARVTLNDQVSTMELMLNPEHLGKVSLSVSLKEGVVTAQIVAENQTAREAIEGQIVMLKEQLNSQGLKVEAVEVTIASHSFEAGYNRNSEEQAGGHNGRRGGTRHIDLSRLTEEGMEDLSDEERITAQMMAIDGNMVNYQA